MDKEDYKKLLDENPDLKLWYVAKSDVYRVFQIPLVSQDHYDLDSCFLTQREALNERQLRLKKKRMMLVKEMENLETAQTEIKLALHAIEWHTTEPSLGVDVDQWDWAFGNRWGNKTIAKETETETV